MELGMTTKQLTVMQHACTLLDLFNYPDEAEALRDVIRTEVGKPLSSVIRAEGKLGQEDSNLRVAD